MGWTNWRLIAKGTEWYSDELDNDGPCVYELAISLTNKVGPRAIMYVGETVNERRRMSQYASDGSHLSKEIYRALGKGYRLYYRAQAKSSKAEAVAAQKRLHKEYHYDWNMDGNLDYE